MGLSQAVDEVLLEAEEEALAHLTFTVSYRTKIRTSNVQEGADREIKRRTNAMQGFPSRESLMRLVGAELIETNEEWSMCRSSPSCRFSAHGRVRRGRPWTRLPCS